MVTPRIWRHTPHSKLLKMLAKWVKIYGRYSFSGKGTSFLGSGIFFFSAERLWCFSNHTLESHTEGGFLAHIHCQDILGARLKQAEKSLLP